MSPRSAATQASLPSTSELVEGVLFYPIALVVSATIFPGFTLCIPGLVFVTVLVLIPIVAVAIVALLAAAVVAAPFLLVRGVRALREKAQEGLSGARGWGNRSGIPRPIPSAGCRGREFLRRP
jgi:membrane protein implicated in regulation of membrane protease activity